MAEERIFLTVQYGRQQLFQALLPRNRILIQTSIGEKSITIYHSHPSGNAPLLGRVTIDECITAKDWRLQFESRHGTGAAGQADAAERDEGRCTGIASSGRRGGNWAEMFHDYDLVRWELCDGDVEEADDDGEGEGRRLLPTTSRLLVLLPSITQSHFPLRVRPLF